MKISEVLALREKKAREGHAPPASASDRTGPAGKKPIRVIRTRETPNPNARQFVLNTQVLSYGKRSYASAGEAAEDAMAQAVFALGGVTNIYIMNNFVTITKAEDRSWNPLEQQAWKAIDQHISIYTPEDRQQLSEIDVTRFMSLPHEKKLQAIEMVLNRSIRSSLAQDGGGVELKGIEGNEVSILYQGACGNCPSSTTGTLQHIERLIKQQLHPDLVVKPV